MKSRNFLKRLNIIEEIKYFAQPKTYKYTKI